MTHLPPHPGGPGPTGGFPGPYAPAGPPPVRTRPWITWIVAIATIAGLWAFLTVPAYQIARTVSTDVSSVDRPEPPSADEFVAGLGVDGVETVISPTTDILSAQCSDAAMARWTEPAGGTWVLLASACTSNFSAAADVNSHAAATTTWDGSHVVGDKDVEMNIHSADGMRAKVWVQGGHQIWVATNCETAECMLRLDDVARLAAASFPGDPADPEVIGAGRMVMGALIAALVVFALPLVIARLMRQRLDSPEVLAAPDGVPAYRDVTDAARRAGRGLVWSKRARSTAIAVGSFAFALGLGDDPAGPVTLGILWAITAVAFVAWIVLRRQIPRTRKPVRVRSDRPVVAVGRGLRRGTAVFVPIWVISVVLLFYAFTVAGSAAPEIHAATLGTVRPAWAGLNPFAFTAALSVLTGAHPVVAVGVTGLLPITAAYFVDRLGQRLAAPTSSELMAADPRPPVLYLRSFDEDKLQLAASATINSVMQRISPWRRRRFEEFLAEELSKLGPVVAISPPGTKLPPLGAARMTLGNDEWQNRVHEIAQRAVCVVMSATPAEVREGLRWEISYLGTHVQHGRILLVVAPWRADEVRRRFGDFLEVASDFPMFRWLKGYPAPDGTHVLWRVPDGRWRSLGTKWRDDISYTVTLSQAVDENIGAWTQALQSVPTPPSGAVPFAGSASGVGSSFPTTSTPAVDPVPPGASFPASRHDPSGVGSSFPGVPAPPQGPSPSQPGTPSEPTES